MFPLFDIEKTTRLVRPLSTMKQRCSSLVAVLFALLFFSLPALAQQETGASSSSEAAAQNTNTAASNTPDTTTQAAAAVASGHADPTPPDIVGQVADSALEVFNVRTSGNTVVHYSIAALLLIISLLARRIVTHLIFPFLRKLAERTRGTLDDKLFAALEAPIAAFIMLLGIFCALRVLKLSPAADEAITYGSRVAFSLVVFWGLWRALAAFLDQATEVARRRGSPAIGFMPWIKKSVLTIFVVFAALLTIQSLGYDVKAILAGLGIGGLAFALAAQDPLANVFGAIVVAVDQPFKHGEVVNIQGKVGAIEDIGIRSTRIRMTDGSLLVMPNKTVAGETITNLSRFTKRRFEQVIGLTYDTKPEDMEAIIQDIRRIITSEPGVNPNPMVFFRDLSASSLDIWIVYEFPSPDFMKAIAAKQRINLEIMRAVQARGLSFAFPTQTLHLEGEALQKIAAASEHPDRPPAA